MIVDDLYGTDDCSRFPGREYKKKRVCALMIIRGNHGECLDWAFIRW